LKFVDPDGEDISVFFTDSGPAGHAMLLAYDQQNGNAAAHSFGPANHSVGTELTMAVPFTSVPGTENYDFSNIQSADQLRQEYVSITIQTSPEETEKAIQFMKAHPDGNYKTYSNNCATTCANILRYIQLIDSQAITPAAFFSDLTYKFGKTYYNPVVNAPQYGKDYGNPRTGYDAFRLMFMTLQQQVSQPKKKEVVISRICYSDDNSKQHCQ
jgi:hypothetical protein